MKLSILKISHPFKQKLYHLSISHKLTIGFSLLVGLSLGVMGRNYLGNVVATTNIQRTQKIRVPAALTSARAESSLLRMSSHVRGYLATGDSDFRDRYHKARQEFEAELLQLKAVLVQDSTANNLELFGQMQTKYETWKLLPDQLFSLRDNYLLNEPALGLLKDDGESLIYGIQSNTQAVIELQGQQTPSRINTQLLKDLATFQSSFALLVSSLRGYLVTQNPSLRFEYGGHLIANQEAWDQLQGKVMLLTEEQGNHIKVIAKQRQEFMKLSPNLFDIVEGDEKRQDLLIFSTQAEPLVDEMFILLQQIVESQQTALSEELNTVNRGLDRAQFQMIFGGGLSLVFVLVMAWFLRKKIADPISRLIRATAQITEGDFNAKAQVESGDEIGTLATTFNQMTDYLKESRHELENYSKTLEKQAIALEEAIDEAKTANESKSVFLANMSHELRSPLNAILGFAQVMSRDSHLTTVQKDNLAIINRSGEHLLSLINDILELTKVEAGKIEITLMDCDLTQMLESVEGMFRLKAQNKGLDLMVQLTDAVLPYIRIDAGKLKQILINLLDNAIKFTEQGTVSLKIEPVKFPTTSDSQPQITNHPEQYIHFEVLDTGFGIASDDLENLFDPFVQTESGHRSQKGTGLGLAICRHFVEMMGGVLRVESQLNQGTCFSFDLRVEVIQESSVQKPSTGKIVSLASGISTPTILIVEDKWENREVLIQLLSAVGYSIQEAENGQRGVEMWQQWQPDLILMDIQMPVLNGIEATQRIRSHSTLKQPKIVAISAGAFDEKRRNAIAAGCDDFIRKPFQERLLLEKLAQHLGINYVEQSSSEESMDNSLPLDSLTSATLQVMPQLWLEKMNQAAKTLNTALTIQLLEEIPPEHDPLKSCLRQMIQNFDFDKIIALTQKALPETV